MPCLQLGENGGSHGLVAVCQDQSEGEVLQKPGAAALLPQPYSGLQGPPAALCSSPWGPCRRGSPT